MPLTQLVSTAIDRVGPERTRIVAETAGYAVSDLVSFRAEMPADLVARQRLTWDPLIAWMRDRFDVAFQVTAGVMPVAQLPATLAKLERVVSAQDDFRLTALATLTGAAGSLVIGLAVLEGRLGPQEAATAAQLDELYQAEFWGIDPEAEIRRAGQRADIVHARRFLDLLAAD
jgi:chaperone required for assembly of F1-ATPase